MVVALCGITIALILLSLFCTLCTSLNVVNTDMTSLPYANEDLWKVGLPMQDASLCVPLWLGVTDELAILLTLYN